MQVQFIDSITADNKVFVFRFTKDSYENKYMVSLLTNTSIPAFTIVLDPIHHCWKLEPGVNVRLRIFERTLGNLIDEHNHRYNLLTSDTAHIAY